MKKISEGEIKAVVSNDSREEIHQYVDRLNGRCFTSDVAVPKLGVRKKLDGFIDKLLADERKKVVEVIEGYEIAYEDDGTIIFSIKDDYVTVNQGLKDIINNLKEDEI